MNRKYLLELIRMIFQQFFIRCSSWLFLMINNNILLYQILGIYFQKFLCISYGNCSIISYGNVPLCSFKNSYSSYYKISFAGFYQEFFWKLVWEYFRKFNQNLNRNLLLKLLWVFSGNSRSCSRDSSLSD